VAENTIETVRLLVVSREPGILRPLCSIGESNCWHLETATSGWDAMERVQSGIAPHLLVLDVPRGDGDSLQTLRWLRRLRPEMPILVLCQAEDASRRNEAIRLGAEDVVVRPFDERHLESVIRRHLISTHESPEADIASEDIERLGEDMLFVSASPTMHKVRAQAELLAQADVPALILGESGSGKDTVARLIHKLSVRSGFRFLKVNCAAMPGNLLETELFGKERNDPTTAGRASSDKFELRENGTIFLDEIAEMPASAQAQLLHVLQHKEVLSLGGHQAVRMNVRILAATSANLEHALAEKKLREDLYYRLSAFTVHVPPLRQRKEEIVILLRHLMHKLARHYGLPPREFSSTILDACLRYSWPGNLNELETFVKRYLVAGESELSFGALESGGAGNGDRLHISQTLRLAATERAEGGNGEPRTGPQSLKSLIQNVKWEAERNAIGAALEKTGWNRKAAARLLKVSYRTLLYKIDQYHMSASEPFFSPLPGNPFPTQGNGNKGNGKAS